MDKLIVKTYGFAEKPEEEVRAVLSLHSSQNVEFQHFPEMRDIVLKTAVPGIVVRTKMLAIVVPVVSEYHNAIRDISQLVEYCVVASVQNNRVVGMAVGGKNFAPDSLDGILDSEDSKEAV